MSDVKKVPWGWFVGGIFLGALVLAAPIAFAIHWVRTKLPGAKAALPAGQDKTADQVAQQQQG